MPDQIVNIRTHVRSEAPTKPGAEEPLATVFQYPAPEGVEGYAGPPAGEEFVIVRILGRKEAGAVYPFSVWLVGYDNGAETKRLRVGREFSWRGALMRASDAVAGMAQAMNHSRIIVAAVSKQGEVNVVYDQTTKTDDGGE